MIGDLPPASLYITSPILSVGGPSGLSSPRPELYIDARPLIVELDLLWLDSCAELLPSLGNIIGVDLVDCAVEHLTLQEPAVIVSFELPQLFEDVAVLQVLPVLIP